MNNIILRLESIEVENLKNVVDGKISLLGSSPVSTTLANISANSLISDIIGIYGQNGSGKTAVVDSFYFLKKMLSGEELDSDTEKYIKDKSKYFKCSFVFFLFKTDSTNKIAVSYSFSVGHNGKSFFLQAEELKFATLTIGKKLSYKKIIDYNSDLDKYYENFSSAEYLSLIKRQPDDVFKRLQAFLLLNKDLKKSFIFASQNMSLLIKAFSKERFVNTVLKSLNRYARSYLFVFRNDFSAKNMTGIEFHLSFSSDMENKRLIAEFMYNYSTQSILLPERAFVLWNKIIENLNCVLRKIIFDMTISLEKLEITANEKGEKLYKVMLFSNRKGTLIPMKYESDGVKKLVSMLGVIINMYNNPAVTLVIDELDSGIFEYLLGEIVKVLEESGKGQFIFTSHNLRPLELLDYKSLYFTTINENNRYIQLSAIKTNNNVRKVYYNAVQLGGQKEELYDMVDTSEIRDSLHEAGYFTNNGEKADA